MNIGASLVDKEGSSQGREPCGIETKPAGVRLCASGFKAPLSLPIPTLLPCWLPPRGLAHSRQVPHPRATSRSPWLLSSHCSLSFSLSAGSTCETQGGLNGVHARNPPMKSREVFLSPARAADRQLCCMAPSRLPHPPAPAARCSLGVAEPGSLQIRCVLLRLPKRTQAFSVRVACARHLSWHKAGASPPAGSLSI